MLVRVAEESFDKGMSAMDQGRRDEALAFFEAAIALENKFGAGSPQPRYLSQYGLCLGLLGRRKYEGVRFCREAVAKEGYNADLLWNLGRVLLVANRRGEAHAALDHPGSEGHGSPAQAVAQSPGTQQSGQRLPG